MTGKAVVLLFGAFNPFTNAHLMIGRMAKEVCPEHEICYVPARLSYFTDWKKAPEGDVLPGDLRLDMARGAVKGVPDFEVSDAELRGIVSGKTYDTVRYFKNQLGYRDVILCMGTDKIRELETWYRGKELVRENRFLVVRRGEIPFSDCMTDFLRGYRSHFTELEHSEIPYLSATEIREAVRRGDWEFVESNVPEYVYQRLLENKQYFVKNA